MNKNGLQVSENIHAAQRLILVTVVDSSDGELEVSLRSMFVFPTFESQGI